MKNKIITIMLGMILLISLASAGLLDGIGTGEEPIEKPILQKCKVIVEPNKAVEEYTYTKYTPIMESQTIYVNKTILQNQTIYVNKTIYETQTIDKPVMDYSAMKLRAEQENLAIQEALNYNEKVRINNTLLTLQKKPLLEKVIVPTPNTTGIYTTVKQEVQVPTIIQEPKTISVPTTIQEPKTIQVQKTSEVNKYRFVKSFPFVERYTVQVKQFNTEQVTDKRIVKGVTLDTETGEFIKWEMKEKC